ncbi:hypothetical protein XI09_15420 [Bradyrhizobium sp. CCBAU 11386]|nr:hypothetical protein [Bradyrhizobium sp. CCBAU 11386]
MAERDQKDAVAYHQMEGDLRDLANMGRITAQLGSNTDGEPRLCEKRNLALFAVYHLHAMPLEFEKKYDDGDFHTGSATGSG